AGASLIGLTSALFSDLPEALGEAAAVVDARTKRALEAVERVKAGRPLLTVTAAGGARVYCMKDIAALSGDERGRLEDLLPERRGQTARIRRLLELAGVPP